MHLGMVGLGRMGANMVRRMRRAGIDVAGFDRDRNVVEDLARENGMLAVRDLQDLVASCPAPRALWMMLPAGEVTEQQIEVLRPLLAAGDTLVDGANSYFKDSIRRAEALAQSGIGYLDVGVSGGIWGLEEGYALMVGGAAEGVSRVRPVLEVLAPAPDRGWVHCGPSGSGHFVKMIHNGIEYGMMQAYAEGFTLLKGREEFALDLSAIAETWRHGSVVRSWLLDLTAEFLSQDQHLEHIEPFAAESGAGRWSAIEAIDQGVPAPVISTALMMRFASQGRADYAARMLAMMRAGFGGHAIKEAQE